MLQDRILAFEAWEGIPPIQESRTFYSGQVEFTIEKMPYAANIHRHYYLIAKLHDQQFSVGGVGEDNDGWFVYLDGLIFNVGSYKDGMSMLLDSKHLYYGLSQIRDSPISIQV